MAYNRFRALGAFVYTGENLTDDHLHNFSWAGGKWIAPVIYEDDRAGPWNVANLTKLQNRANQVGLEVGGWFNATNKQTPYNYARDIAALTLNYHLPLVILDAELAYAYPSPGVQLLPELMQRLRDRLPATDLLLSSLGPNNAYIYNGRTLAPPRSMYDLKWRHGPQWYSSYYNRDGATTPQARMKWLKQNAHTDFNIKDPTAPYNRGLPLSFIHPTTEATGLEGSDLEQELKDIKEAQQYGLTAGISYYSLERAPAADFTILRKYKNILFV